MSRHRRRRRLPAALLAAALLVVVAVGLLFGAVDRGEQRRAAGTATSTPTSTATSSPELRPLGPPPAGYAWLSGAWTGARMSAEAAHDFGVWRGRPSDIATTYPERHTFAELKASSWAISTYDGFPGRLAYGLPLLSEDPAEGSLRDVANGRYDDVWTQVAKDLVEHGRGTSIVRVGWEANGKQWFRWGATAATAADYKAAYRHVVGVLRRTAPHLVMSFDLSCGTGLEGSTDRTAALTALYPGDDVVDIVGCDVYDTWKTRAANEAQFQQSLRPQGAVGLADVVDFARAHGKQYAVPEWGLWDASDHGGGDNPFFITRMHQFFTESSTQLAYEAYFDDPGQHVRASIWVDPSQNPQSSAVYRTLFQRRQTSGGTLVP